MKKPKIRALQNAEESKARIIQQVNSRLDEQPKKKVSRLLPLTAGLLATAVALFLLWLPVSEEPQPAVGTEEETAEKLLMKQQLEDQNQMEIWQTAEGYELRYYAFDEGKWYETEPIVAADSFSWGSMDISGQNLFMVMGVMTDEQLERVHVIDYNLDRVRQQAAEQYFVEIDEYAAIFEAGSTKIWYALMADYEGRNPETLRIEAEDENLEVIWRSGFYDGQYINGYHPVKMPEEPAEDQLLTLYQSDGTASFIEPYDVAYNAAEHGALIPFIFNEVKTFEVTLRGYEWAEQGKTLILDLGEGYEKIQGSSGAGIFGQTLDESYFETYPKLKTIIYTHERSFRSKLDHFGFGFPYTR